MCVPINEDFSFQIGEKDATETTENTENSENSKESNTTEINKDSTNTAEDNKFSSDPETKDETLFWLFITAFGLGLIAIVTPCVFPMIPMTVTFFLHDKDGRGKSKALFFGGSIIFIYVVLGLIFAAIFGPAAANIIATHWIPNLLFFVVFLIFAASFLGMFEIQLPSWIADRSDKQADKGGFFAPFFMALTLAVVSFSCTGPFVATLLAESAGGDFIKPIVGMFGFSLAFALPFTLFAFFPQWLKGMKSGGWLNSVKVVLGFAELAFALKFLSIADLTYDWRILDREVFLALWIVIFSLMGFYLLGTLKFSHDSELPKNDLGR